MVTSNIVAHAQPCLFKCFSHFAGKSEELVALVKASLSLECGFKTGHREGIGGRFRRALARHHRLVKASLSLVCGFKTGHPKGIRGHFRRASVGHRRGIRGHPGASGRFQVEHLQSKRRACDIRRIIFFTIQNIELTDVLAARSAIFPSQKMFEKSRRSENIIILKGRTGACTIGCRDTHT